LEQQLNDNVKRNHWDLSILSRIQSRQIITRWLSSFLAFTVDIIQNDLVIFWQCYRVVYLPLYGWYLVIFAGCLFLWFAVRSVGGTEPLVCWFWLEFTHNVISLIWVASSYSDLSYCESMFAWVEYSSLAGAFPDVTQTELVAKKPSLKTHHVLCGFLTYCVGVMRLCCLVVFNPVVIVWLDDEVRMVISILVSLILFRHSQLI